MDSYSTYDSSLYSTDSMGADAGITAAAIIGALVIYLVVFAVAYVITAIFLGKIFKKAGTPSWIAWVPIYNSWKMLELGGQHGWWVLLSFVPFVNLASLVFMIIAMYHIGKKLGKEDWFVLLAIFLGPVWLIWLGADSSTWDDSKGAPRLDTPTTPVAPAAAPVANQEMPAAPVQPQVTMPTDENTQTPQTPPTNPTV